MPGLSRVLAAALLLPSCVATPAPAPPAAPGPAKAIAAPPPPGPAPAPDPRAELAQKIDPIFSAYTAPGAMSPGCALGVYRAGEVLFSKGYGYADLEHDAPITDATPFYTASVSKQFTAAAVLLLAADGKLSLDDDVRRYVPELPDYGDRITLAELLHHTSGLRDYHLLLQLEGLNEEDVITRREVLWLLAHQRALNFRPGAHFSYTSSGYVLLAEIVARVSGESFGAFLTRRVLAPLGMTSSHVREDHARPVPQRAIGYAPGPDKKPRTLMGNLEYDGSSNFVTTTRDLARWDAEFYDPKVGGQALVDAMRVVGKLGDGTALDYAMGLAVGTYHGLPCEWHDGGFAGYRSYLVRYPTERLTVSLLCNTTEADTEALADAVTAIFLPQITAAAAPDGPPSPPTAPFGFDLASVAGTYVDLSTGETRAVDVAGGVVHARYAHPSARARELVPAGPGQLVVKGAHTRYAFEPAKGKRAARLVRLSATDAARTFVRTEPLERVERLADYAGRFASDELAHDLEVSVEDGHLVSGPVGGAPRRSPYLPVARDFFVTEDPDWNDVGWRFERDARGKVVRLVASTDRAREVVLVRR